ncbi:hypothetical protein I2I05_08530 [Hymenobacter sp. BT683]|uniref:Uncharacterized protein n=1 Tax=Hymenobacter jeongseonensis TaxID=2791027 RepID=A0ABS0IGG5_9BACT|nr:hypothetical protein [Hymenobacter jeongseonensis]MBF9237442.1 hypothetical protein [Hymenobacter jeongseonensis]
MTLTRTAAGRKIQFYWSLPPAKAKYLELWEQSTFDFWSRKTWVKFMFVYADNELNRKAGRVGKISSFRIGTRNVDLIPTADKPKSRGDDSVKRYYDVSRAGTNVLNGVSSGGLRGKVTSNAAQPGQWRSFRPSTFSIMVEIWSFEREAWVDRLEDFNIRDQNSG